LIWCLSSLGWAQEIAYRVSFPAPEHRWMQVEVTIDNAPRPLELRMSRSSPGRYALHEFAKNVYDVQAFDAGGEPLAISRPDPYQWNVEEHPGTVRVSYKVFGERIDGTYLAIDTTHAHMNIPAAFMWARRAEGRPIRITFVPPERSNWRVATQLFATSDPWTFTAPSLQYFMDSPTELGPVWEDRFTLPQPDGSGVAAFRIALHQDRPEERGAESFAAAVRKIAAEQGAIFGEFPRFEPGYYTFLADYLPDADGDGMEHRNSTVITGRHDLSHAEGRRAALGTVSHELFHVWNVERIRPASLEPFDFERANMSGELWLAEGFTSYYGPLVMQRAGLTPLARTLATFGNAIDEVVNGPGRQFRSAVEMSRMAPFVDGARPADGTNIDISFISYYTWGSAIGLALDLSLRDITGGRVTLDDYMRAMWRSHGKPGGAVPGVVAHPYTLDDARARLAEVSGDREFAKTFFARYIEGREAADYTRLLTRAGLVLRRRNAGAAWMGDLGFEPHAQGVRVSRLVAPGTPAYAAGLAKDDVIVALGERDVATAAEIASVLSGLAPGHAVPVRYLRRGAARTAAVALIEDPRFELVALESSGGTLSAEQRTFRDAWLGSRMRRPN
jgi:predicted metalloprotease with PDZ domain